MGGSTPSLSEETLAVELGNAVTQSYTKARAALAPIAGDGIARWSVGSFNGPGACGEENTAILPLPRVKILPEN
jgi:hypothetical protein